MPACPSAASNAARSSSRMMTSPRSTRRTRCVVQSASRAMSATVSRGAATRSVLTRKATFA